MSSLQQQMLFPDPQNTPSARDDMNFVEFPMAVLSARAPKDCTELVFEDTFPHKGRPITRRLTVTASPKYGLPTVKDEEVLLGLLAMTKQRNNFSSPHVQFTRYELIQLLGLNDEGHTYQRITHALDCWASVYLKYENAWYDNERKEYIDRGFHVLEQWSATRPERGTRGGSITIKWNDIAFKSFQADYVKKLDLNFYQSLQSGISKRLYRFLDKHLYHPPHRREFELDDLAFAHLGLSRGYGAWKAKQVIDPAIHELEDRGFLLKLSDRERYVKVGRGCWRVVFEKVAAVEVEAAKPAALPAPAAESPLVAELVKRGLHIDSARKLVSEKPAEVIADRIEAFDWLMKGKHPPEKPSGYLFTSIAKELPLPDGFKPASVRKAEAEKRKQAQEEKTKKSEQEHEERQAEREREERRRARVDAFLETLTPEQRAKFEERAIQSGPSSEVEHYRKCLGTSKFFAEKVRYKLLELAIDNAPRASA